MSKINKPVLTRSRVLAASVCVWTSAAVMSSVRSSVL